MQLSPCFADKAAQREVLQLEVQCINVDYGCKWIGKLEDFINVSQLYKISPFLIMRFWYYKSKLTLRYFCALI